MSYLVRAFLPSWKFFEDSGDSPLLFYRMSFGEQDFGSWEACLKRPKRRWRALFLNSEANDLLACGALLQRLVNDLSELEDEKTSVFEDSVSYQLVKNLVSHRILADRREAEVVRYQFKISVTDDVLISPIYEA